MSLIVLVDPISDGMRLDVFLASILDSSSRSACARLIADGKVCINDTEALSKSERVRLGDRIAVQVDDEEEHPKGRISPNPAIHLDVRFEDDYLLVISKQAGLVCHPSPGHVDDTLSNALVAHCGYEHLGMLQGEDRPGIVHRLDMDTSGLMLAAKDDDTQHALQDLIRLRVLDRRYITLVQGYVAPNEGVVTTGIARSPRDRLRMTVSNDPLAREAITTFRTLCRFEADSRDDGFSLLECHLYTGRTHQIRVHMRHIGHPVVGDPLYGIAARRPKMHVRDLGLERQFLHSWHLVFDHPVTGEHVVCADKLPADLTEALRGLKSRSMGLTDAGREVLPQLL
ncbi:MAG: RluA family pseudouridine synthase [Coriobacteriales bacterium]|nr:RluA family pseudouridine synthase [Coriobacteriales bacterium]